MHAPDPNVSGDHRARANSEEVESCGRGWALTAGLNAYAANAAVDPWVKAATTRQIQETLAG
ncbi:hypothetical protein GCM10009838_64160 [Catenulispora subtropica]|uniref:Uncharacterized protein n=1 Tax=Catenulispora subtropica TaxID=450798 RepID=A0ABN2SSF9_9ACTN